MIRNRPILGIGIDLVSVGKMKRLIRENGPPFLRMIYTDREINYCEKRKNAYELYAAFFAAKEAFVKALGTGFVGRIQCTDVEVHLEGGVFIETRGPVKRIMREKVIGQVIFDYGTNHEFSVATIILL